ncbi:FAD-dependent oxidoreductase [Roseovarius sp. 2305UL8-3]|uniref:FAD-dependent oxidoreductase n=1 Tax=Roseovarius conchicola TaxID=3121636 RepID=UPI003529B6E4
MTEAHVPDIRPIIIEAGAKGMCVTSIYSSGSGDYDKDRQVHNARLQFKPQAIFHCRHADDVSFLLKRLYELKKRDGRGVPVTIRSGGHHHEAMCMNSHGAVLALDEINMIDVDDDKSHVWLGSGRRLDEVIKRLAEDNRLLPTGGCDTVNVGGLTNGGGWGLSYRTLGLTVDMLREVEMVLPNGDIVQLDKDRFTKGETSMLVNAPALFKAIRGGGGGNFGVVTRFRFQLTEFDPEFCTFTLQYGRELRTEMAERWAKVCEDADHRLNLFARMTVVPEGPHIDANPAFLIGGRFYGSEEECEKAIAPLMIYEGLELKDIRSYRFDSPENFIVGLFPGREEPARGRDGTPLPAQGFALQVGAGSMSKPTDTCITCPEPHKVSSSMPAGNAADIADAAKNYIDCYPVVKDVNMYLSWHGMGGQGKIEPEGGTSFAWREMPYMLQIQAWWWPDSGVNEQAVLNWVTGFREALAPYTTGAFINFPDADQDVETYYSPQIYSDLQDVKTNVDPHNLLKFDLGIPPR